MLQLQIAGTDKVLKAFNRASAELQRNTVKALYKAGTLVEREAKKNVSGPVLKAPHGILKSSIRTTPVDEAKMEVRVGTNIIYGPVHEFGATIRPKAKKWLRWFVGGNPDTGKAIFAKKVVIPKRPWLGPAFEQATAGIKAIFQKACGDAIEGMKK